jgi:hypothetical protein
MYPWMKEPAPRDINHRRPGKLLGRSCPALPLHDHLLNDYRRTMTAPERYEMQCYLEHVFKYSHLYAEGDRPGDRWYLTQDSQGRLCVYGRFTLQACNKEVLPRAAHKDATKARYDRNHHVADTVDGASSSGRQQVRAAGPDSDGVWSAYHLQREMRQASSSGSAAERRPSGGDHSSSRWGWQDWGSNSSRGHQGDWESDASGNRRGDRGSDSGSRHVDWGSDASWGGRGRPVSGRSDAGSSGWGSQTSSARGRW